MNKPLSYDELQSLADVGLQYDLADAAHKLKEIYPADVMLYEVIDNEGAGAVIASLRFNL